MKHQIGDEVYVKDYTTKHELCRGEIKGLWGVAGLPTKYVVNFIGSDGSACAGTFTEDDIAEKAELLVPFGFDIGDDVWYWYYDDNDYHVWYGTIKEFTEDNKVYVTYISYIDCEEYEEEPIEVGFTLKPDQIFETRLEAVVDAALEHQELIDQALTDELKQEEEAKKAWEYRTRHVFPFKEGDTVYVVIPYASGALVELKQGTVEHKPQSDNPKWFSFMPLKSTTSEMAPVAFCGLTPEEAAKLYADSRYKCLLDVFNKDPNHE